MSILLTGTTVSTGVAPLAGRELLAADLGYSYVAVTPTPGTGIIGHAVSTTLVETKAIFVCYNGGTATIYPTHLRLTMTALPVANTMQQFTTVLDQGNRIATAATALTIANTHMNSANVSAAQISVGAVVTSAATSQRRIHHHRVKRPVIGVIGDVYQWNYGSGTLVDPSALPVEGTLRAHILTVTAPIVLPPGYSMLIHAWGATFSTGATYEYEFAFLEK